MAELFGFSITRLKNGGSKTNVLHNQQADDGTQTIAGWWIFWSVP